MTKRTFRNFRISQLNGGVNVRDYPSEIQNKQFISLSNFNFFGNKLVSSKGMQIKYNNSLSGKINGILVDGNNKYNNIYYSHGGKVYKNGVELPITLGILPNKKCYISVWWDLVFFTFDDGTTAPMYLDGTILTTVTGLGTPRYNIVYNGKWILGGYGNDNIYFSKTATPTSKVNIYDFSSYSGGNQSVGGDSKGIITGFKVGENGLYVFKEDSTYYSNTEKDTGVDFNFVFRKITTNGAINQNGITEVEQEIFYFDGFAIRRLGYEKNLTTLRDTAISREIEPLIHQYLGDQSGLTSSYKYPNYKLFLKSELVGSDVNDICFTYNIENKSWTTETNKDCSVSAKGFLGSSYNSIIYKDDVTDNILDKGIISEGISKEYIFTDAVDYKSYGEVEIVGAIESGTTLTLNIYVGGEQTDSIDITRTGALTSTLGTKALGGVTLGGDGLKETLIPFKERIEMYDSGQNIQFGLIKNGLGGVEISNLNIRWKMDYAFDNY